MAVFNGQCLSNVGENRPQQLGHLLGFVGKGEEEIRTTHLGIAEMIAGPSILPTVPLDLLLGKVGSDGLADLGKQVFFGTRMRKAIRIAFLFIEAIYPRGQGKSGRTRLERRQAFFSVINNLATMRFLCRTILDQSTSPSTPFNHLIIHAAVF